MGSLLKFRSCNISWLRKLFLSVIGLIIYGLRLMIKVSPLLILMGLVISLIAYVQDQVDPTKSIVCSVG